MLSRLKTYLRKKPGVKRLLLQSLMPRGQARPRNWVRVFLNPFVHKRGKGSRICPSVRMDVMPFNRFSLGKRSTIEDYAAINNGMGPVLIGNGTRVGLGNIIIGPVTIGNNVLLAQHIVVSGINHSYQDVSRLIREQPCTAAPITIEDDCWIGANSVITAGVRVGHHSVVAAGSVVIHEVPPYSVVAGNPARVIRQYNFETASWEVTVSKSA